MKPNDIPNEVGVPDRIESHPPPTLRSQLITAVRLFAIASLFMLTLWFVDQIVSG